MQTADVTHNPGPSDSVAAEYRAVAADPGIVRAGISLRARLIFGAVAIATVAVFAAALAAWGTVSTSHLIERSAAAQARSDLLSGLSARVYDYAVVAVETTAPSVPRDARAARLGSLEERVRGAFNQIDLALAQAVANSERDGQEAQMRRATRSLVIARMNAQFDALVRSISTVETASALRTHLDGFATHFSPLINELIAEEQRDRNQARSEVSSLRGQMIWLATGAGLVAASLVVLFYFTLVRPLIGQLHQIQRAAADIGQGNFTPELPKARSPELQWVSRELGRTADALRTREIGVQSDRSDLNRIISDRTFELEQANARLSQIDRDRRRFFADIGHELRTPLTVILAESELSLRCPADTSDARESLSVIHARARRLNRRIDDLLRVARSETGQIELNLAPFDMSKAAAEAAADLQPLATRQGSTLTTALETAQAIGDKEWCRQIIGGLIENALKHAGAGSTVEIRSRTGGIEALVEVVDDGPGIPANEFDVVFDRFAQGTRDQDGVGFGIGLALARWVTEKQAGTLTLACPAQPNLANGPPGLSVCLALPHPGNTDA